jgi:hypothetical protein
MGELVMFPMVWVTLKKEERTCTVIYAKSSDRIINVTGLPHTWLNTDATLGLTRLKSAGWEQTGTGKVKP